VTSRLGTEKLITFFYSVFIYQPLDDGTGHAHGASYIGHVTHQKKIICDRIIAKILLDIVHQIASLKTKTQLKQS